MGFNDLEAGDSFWQEYKQLKILPYGQFQKQKVLGTKPRAKQTNWSILALGILFNFLKGVVTCL